MKKNLRQHRKDAYMSIRDLARKAEIKDSTIWRIESGATKNMHPTTMRKIAEALGVHPTEITEFVLPEN